MSGFDIVFSGRNIRVSAEYGFLLLNIIRLSSDENATIDIYGTDYEMQVRKIWLSGAPIKLGDMIEIKLCEIHGETLPDRELFDENIQRLTPEMKLKAFYELENYLNKKGLL